MKALVDFTTIPPWIATGWLQPPQQFTADPTSTAPIPFVPSDPMRIVLLFGNVSQGNVAVLVGPSGIQTAGKGLPMAQAVGSPIVLSHWLNGPIVTAAWTVCVQGAAQGNAVAYSWSLKDWPDIESVEIPEFMRPLPKPKRSPIDSRPGVNGGRGLLDWWLKRIGMR